MIAARAAACYSRGMSQLRHLTSLEDLSADELSELLDLSLSIKRAGASAALAQRSIGLLFFRGSLRTRTSFEVATHQLGGHTVNLTASSDFWDLEAETGSVMDGRAPEHVKDAARVLSRYVDALAIRPAPMGQSWELDRRDTGIRAWTENAEVPVINMESSLWHPLQALADLMTMRETLGDLRGKKLSIVWTHSPTPASPAVVHSLLCGAVREGMEVSITHPPGYELDAEVFGKAHELAASSKVNIQTETREAAVDGAQVVYARSWQSLETYGNPTLAASRRSRTGDWRIDAKLMARGENARLMHAMPVRRNLEITDEVLDGDSSLIYQQAENRLHSQKALLVKLLGS